MYSNKDKKILLNILYQNDFNIKKSVQEFNELTTHSLERGTVYDWLHDDDEFKKKFSYFKEELLVFYNNMTLPLGKRTLKKMESLVFKEKYSLNI